MMNKYILLDRDGTINIEKDYLYKIEDFEYEYGVIEALEIFQKKGYKLAVITNQSGIGRGYYSEEDFLKLTSFVENDLKKKGIIIEKTYYCPHHTDGKGNYKTECECRKPGTLLFEKAVKELDIDTRNTYMLGDKASDLIPADKLGIKPVFLRTGHGREESLKGLDFDFLSFDNILDFAKTL
nr:HAD family hydrolase [Sebaldella termitidis]